MSLELNKTTQSTPRRRGRKPLSAKKELDKDIIKEHLTNLEVHTETLIAHIPLENEDLFECHTFTDNNKIDDVTKLKSKIKELQNEIKLLKEKQTVIKEINRNEPVVIESTLPTFKLNEINEYSSVKCWWCCNTFKSKAIYLPHKLINNIYYVTGIFCSFNCVLSYNYNIKDAYTVTRANLIYLMYSQLLSPIEHIVPAPPKEVLIEFGGYLTIDEYREKSVIYSREIKVVLPPMKSLHLVIEDINFNYPSNKKEFIPLNEDDLQNAKKQLKLKRSQPKKSNFISIEESLGLIKV
jgi:hypothetical protein